MQDDDNREPASLGALARFGLVNAASATCHACQGSESGDCFEYTRVTIAEAIDDASNYQLWKGPGEELQNRAGCAEDGTHPERILSPKLVAEGCSQ